MAASCHDSGRALPPRGRADGDGGADEQVAPDKQAAPTNELAEEISATSPAPPSASEFVCANEHLPPPPPPLPPSSPGKPARRRRLARRRQYARSQRASATFLRSQFVRYEDSLEVDANEQLRRQAACCQPAESRENWSADELLLVGRRELVCAAPARLPAQETRLDEDEVARLADYSSSSLDSSSPADFRLQQQAQLQVRAGAGSILASGTRQLIQATTKSLVSLTNVGKWQQRELDPFSARNEVAQQSGVRKQVVQARKGQPASEERDVGAERRPKVALVGQQHVRRSETVDLATAAANARQQRNRFFPSAEFGYSVERAAGRASEHFVLLQSSPAERLGGDAQLDAECIDNVHFNDLFQGTVNDSSSSVTVNQSVRTDPRLHKDDVDIKFSRALNSCKLPQIRYASKERLFERLTDLRFLSIDFLNTFLLTYRVFTTAEDVLEALKSVHYNSERYSSATSGQPQLERCSFSANDDSNSFAQSSSNDLAKSTTCVQQSSPSNQRSPIHLPGVPTPTGGSPAPDKTRPAAKLPPAVVAQRKLPPSIPPRSPNTPGDQPQPPPPPPQNAPIDDSFLLSPSGSLSAAAGHQRQRRSTFSALTPITGSSASSLANLASCKPAAAAAARQLAQSPTGQRRAGASVSSSAADESSAALNCCLSSDCDEAHSLESGQSGGRARSASVCVRIADTPSSRGGSPGRPQRQQPVETAATPSGASLAVPNSRQVRANSLSHIAPAELAPRRVSDAAGSGAATCTGSGHWRLSYKKSAQRESPHLPAPLPAQTSFLVPNLLSVCATGQTQTRRKSAADVDKIKLEVRLEPPRQQVGDGNEDNSSQEEIQMAAARLNASSPSFPSVPPSTPVVGLSPRGGGAGSAHESRARKTRHAAAHKQRRAQKLSGGGGGGADSPPQTGRCSLSSSLSSAIDSDDRLPTTRSVSASESESGLIKSSSSGSSVPPPPAPPPRLAQEEPPAPATKTGPHQNGRVELANKDDRNRDTEDEAQLASSKSRRRKQSAVALKEIELTHAKVADCDTSADESSEAKSSSEASDCDGGTVNGQEKEVGEQPPAALCNGPPELPARNSAPTVLPPAAVAAPATPPSAGNRRGGGSQPTSSGSCITTPRSSFQYSNTIGEQLLSSKVGVVVTSKSPRVSSRRSSTASAASAFAAATAASNNPLLTHPPPGVLRAAGGAAGQLEQVGGVCTCGAAPPPHRNSVSFGRPGQQQSLLHNCLRHKLSCAALHFGAAGQSEAASPSNSRASSRLSSCAGLELQCAGGGGGSAFSPAASPSGRVQLGSGARLSQASCASSCAAGRQIYVAHHNQSKRNSAAAAAAAGSVRSMATLRVLSVLRHWVSKHSQDFVTDAKLALLANDFLHDLIADLSLLPAEHKAAVQLQQMIQKATQTRSAQVDLDVLLAPPAKPSQDSIETLSALEIAEGMTYLDHKIFLAIKSGEFLGQAWMKADKALKAPHILLITKRFNDVSRLVSSEIIRVPEMHRRVSIIEKWTNVAHICRVIHNFNGVLQICAAFTNSAVFRLKKTWDKIPKTTKATIDQLQNLVSTDSRFRNMRDAINRCDPPSIPYVGMYLTDLSFIEEGTPNYSPEGLLNFSKMRMIAHVIREIQHLQNGQYKMELQPRVANYLLDASRHLQDDEMYRCSLAIEPRSSSSAAAAAAAAATAAAAASSSSTSSTSNQRNSQQLAATSQQQAAAQLSSTSANLQANQLK